MVDAENGHGWKDVIRREVLDPLGMRETTARVSTLDPSVIAMPHEYRPGRSFRRVPLGKADANMHAAGGHFATARDLARFVAAHASGGRLNGVQIFPGPSIAAAHEFHRFGWGYGWDLGNGGGRAHAVHYGGETFDRLRE